MSHPGELFNAFPPRFRGLVLTATGLHEQDRQKIKDIFAPVANEILEQDLPYLVEEITDYFTDVHLHVRRNLEYGRPRIDVDKEIDRLKAILAFNRALQRLVINFVSVEQDNDNSAIDFDELMLMERDMSHVNRNLDRIVKGTNLSFIPRMPDYR